MYAVLCSGGKQYKVSADETIKVERIRANVGEEIVFDEKQIVAIGDGSKLRFGKSSLRGASVKAVIINHSKHDKVKIFKMRRRKHYQKHAGHRQSFTAIKIKTIAI